jgi:hypothetical protein
VKPPTAPLALARHDLRVFPLHHPVVGGCSCSRGAACGSVGKHPVHTGWQAESTTDPDAIATLFAADPDANIGVDCGKSGLAVIDTDVRHKGDRSLWQLETEHGALPLTWTVLTSPDARGVRGAHYYFRDATGQIQSSTGKVAPGIDIKAQGGLVAGVGSRHASGVTYDWAPGRSPDDVPLADLPAAWVALLETAGAQTQGEPKASDAPVPSGKRHPFVLSVLAAAQHWGVSPAGLDGIAAVLNTTELAEALPADELAALVAHVGTFAPASAYAEARAEARCSHCAETAERLQRVTERAEASEQKAHAHGTVLDSIANMVSEVGIGNEVRLLIGLELAHYRHDPALEPISGNRYRLTQRLARRLCGVRSLATAGAYARKAAERGLLPLGPEEEHSFTKRDGTRVRAPIITYFYGDAAPAAAKPDIPPEAAHTAVAEANRPVLLRRENRLRARREARGDARRFVNCPECGRTAEKLRPHCGVCDRYVPRVENVHRTAPVARPDQVLQSRSPVYSAKPDIPLCPHGTLKALGAVCHHCDTRWCGDCGREMGSVFRKFCMVPCTPSRETPYPTPPSEVLQDYGAAGGDA